MSIPVLNQVYAEMRRLAIAGSVVAPGDFRLKKLLPPLEQAAARAPVFGRVAEAVKAVVEAKEQESAAALLELTTLVNAILYTQGETGAEGKLEEIETTDLGVPTAQASSRVIKPLLEALTSTGSGRLELIRDAHERGAFRDLRLVKPALAAIDDPYGEIGDFIADKVLPLYGKAIVPELRATFDVKGRGGHPRRLALLHRLDPVGSRELVKNALENGSKEVNIVAIECLGEAGEDLSYLLEQASAKAQEVRQAAYRALAKMDEPEAVAALQKAAAGKDLALAAGALQSSRHPGLLQYLLAEGKKELEGLAKIKDKKELSGSMDRLVTLLGCLAGRDEPHVEAFVLEVFRRRNELAKLKGATTSGSDLNQTVAQLMSTAGRKLQTTLAEAHAQLNSEELRLAFRAARQALPAPQVFEMFASYLTAKVDEKKKQRDPAWARREAIIDSLGGARPHYYWAHEEEEAQPPLDPRWLDVAVAGRHLGLVRVLARPDHAGARTFLKETFGEVLKKSKSLEDCHEVVAAMIHAQHPDAADAFIAAFEKHGKKTSYYTYWFARLILDLPKSAIPKLEELASKMGDKVADNLIDYIQQLRGKAGQGLPAP